MFHRPSKKLCGIGLLAAGLSLLPTLGAQTQAPYPVRTQ